MRSGSRVRDPKPGAALPCGQGFRLPSEALRHRSRRLGGRDQPSVDGIDAHRLRPALPFQPQPQSISELLAQLPGVRRIAQPPAQVETVDHRAAQSGQQAEQRRGGLVIDEHLIRRIESGRGPPAAREPHQSSRKVVDRDITASQPEEASEPPPLDLQGQRGLLHQLLFGQPMNGAAQLLDLRLNAAGKRVVGLCKDEDHDCDLLCFKEASQQLESYTGPTLSSRLPQ